MKEKFLYIWLSNLQFLSYNEIDNLISVYDGDIEKMYLDTNISTITQNLSSKKKDLYIKSKNKNTLNGQLKYIVENNIEVITYNDKKYPRSLKNIYDPPYTIYCKGVTELLNSGCGVAIVGARKCSEYGRNVVNYIVNGLCGYDIPIISGMAKGIDGEAHRVCIRYGKPTIAVLGCGIDIIYPKENVDIAQSITKEGCIISEFPIGTKPFASNFPRRNRIISGLSSDVVVIEAKYRSGSLITANIAIEQGKNVYAVPGDIFREESMGCNELIQQGAFALYNKNLIFDTSIEIREFLNLKTNDDLYLKNQECSDNIQKQSIKIINKLDYPKDVYELSRDTNIDIIEMNRMLTNLEIDGVIGKNYMNKYYKVCEIK